MKKRLMSVLLVTILSLTAITGCGERETNGDAGRENIQESVVAQPTEAPATVLTEESTTAPSAPTKEPIPELTKEPTPQPSIEPTAEPVAEPTMAPESTEATGNVDWSKAYEDYFERENTTYENLKMTTSISRDGITFAIEAAAAGDNTYMNFDFESMGLEMYINQEKVYTCTKMKGQEIWEYALLETEDDAEDIKDMGEIVNTDNYEVHEYYGEVTEGDVIYDVLYIAHKDGEEIQQEGYCYINRETQIMEKITVTANDQEAVVYFEEIDGIELPAEVMTATETTMEEVATTLLTIIFMGSLSQAEGMGY